MRRMVLCTLTVLLILAMPFGASAQVPNVPASTLTQLSLGNLNPNMLNNARGVAVDGAGDVFVADTNNQRILEITSAGVPSVVAGIGNPPGPGFGGDGGLATNALLSNPSAVAVDSLGRVYIADTGNNRVRMFVPGSTIQTVAGSAGVGYSGDGGLATRALLNNPTSIAVDTSGNLYIADTNNGVVRMVTAQNGIITTVAGTGVNAFLGDGGLATSTDLDFPAGVAVDTAGNVYVSNSNRIEKFQLGGDILTVANGNNNPNGGNGDGGPASAANININGFTVDPFGNIYIGDQNHASIRFVQASTGIISTLVQPTALALNARALALDSNGDVYVVNNGQTVLEVTFSALRVGSASAPQGGIAQVPLTLTLTSGVSIDSLGINLSVSYPAVPSVGAISFTPAAGISGPNVPLQLESGPNMTNVVFAWVANLSSTPPGTVSGPVTIPLGTLSISIPANAPVGQDYFISVQRISADLSGPAGALTAVTLANGAPGPLPLNVLRQCQYLVGDTYPGTPATTQCGQFGDDQFSNISFEDVIVALRAWAAIPLSGWDTLSPASDLFDALDSFPTPGPGNQIPNVGGDGCLTLGDVIETLNRWANVDGSREIRLAGTYLQRVGLPVPATCPAGAPDSPLISQSSRGDQLAAFHRPAASSAVELGSPMVAGNKMRVPVYARASRSLTSVGFSVGWNATTAAKLTFVAGPASAPTVLDTEIPGMVTAAWLQEVPVASGQRVLLGYLEWDRSEGAAPAQLQVYKAEVNSLDLAPRSVETQGGALQ